MTVFIVGTIPQHSILASCSNHCKVVWHYQEAVKNTPENIYDIKYIGCGYCDLCGDRVNAIAFAEKKAVLNKYK